MGATIKDVARETNLAISTISKYLNGGKVRKQNEEVIEKAIRDLNYSPNSVARGLRNSRSYRIGLIASAGDDPHISRLIDQIERQLWKEGYSLTHLCVECGDVELKQDYIDFIVESGIDGLIINSDNEILNHLESVKKENIPVVVMEECYSQKEFDCVQADCAGGAYQAVEYLVNAGHDKIAVICGPDVRETAIERKRGFYRVLEDYEMTIPKKYILDGKYTYEGGYECLKQLWKLQERPSAVFVGNYKMCMGVMMAINELGIRVPQELSVVTFDDLDLSIMVRPKLTAIRQPLEDMANEVCKLLIRRINGDYKNYPSKIRLKTDFVKRDSVAEITDR